MLGILAIVAAVMAMLVALVVGIGMSEMGQAGRTVFGILSPVLVLSTLATLVVVARDDGGPLLAVTAVPPLAIIAAMVADRDLIWGNFPPPRRQRPLQRLAAVGIFALPGLLIALAP